MGDGREDFRPIPQRRFAFRLSLPAHGGPHRTWRQTMTATIVATTPSLSVMSLATIVTAAWNWNASGISDSHPLGQRHRETGREPGHLLQRGSRASQLGTVNLAPYQSTFGWDQYHRAQDQGSPRVRYSMQSSVQPLPRLIAGTSASKSEIACCVLEQEDAFLPNNTKHEGIDANDHQQPEPQCQWRHHRYRAVRRCAPAAPRDDPGSSKDSLGQPLDDLRADLAQPARASANRAQRSNPSPGS